MKYSVIIYCMAAVFITGCKPTEKGYQAAYDAARNKREANNNMIDVNLPEGMLQQVDGPELKTIDGQQVYFLNHRIRPLDKEKVLSGEYNVAVGEYKMSTNANAQSEDLCNDGFSAFAAFDAEGKYYTIAGSFETVQQAVKFVNEYKKGENRVYVGLPDNPVIIYSPLIIR